MDNKLQNEKIHFPILQSFVVKILTSRKFMHHENAKSPIEITLLGIDIFSKLLHQVNAFFSINLIDFGNISDFNELQQLNAPSSMVSN